MNNTILKIAEKYEENPYTIYNNFIFIKSDIFKLVLHETTKGSYYIILKS